MPRHRRAALMWRGYVGRACRVCDPRCRKNALTGSGAAGQLPRATGGQGLGTIQWARLTAAVDAPLRRGAWYRIVAPLTRLEVVVSVQGKRVTVPRPYVEIRATPPREWTVLRNPTVTPRRPAETLPPCYPTRPGW